MAIKHIKTAVLVDCPAFCVGSGEWNDCHTITGNVNFGGFNLLCVGSIITDTVNPADCGFLRLANGGNAGTRLGEDIAFRNNANTQNYYLKLNSTDALLFESINTASARFNFFTNNAGALQSIGSFIFSGVACGGGQVNYGSLELTIRNATMCAGRAQMNLAIHAGTGASENFIQLRGQASCLGTRFEKHLAVDSGVKYDLSGLAGDTSIRECCVTVNNIVFEAGGIDVVTMSSGGQFRVENVNTPQMQMISDLGAAVPDNLGNFKWFFNSSVCNSAGSVNVTMSNITACMESTTMNFNPLVTGTLKAAISMLGDTGQVLIGSGGDFDLAVFAGKRLYFDATSGGGVNDFLTASTANQLSYFSNDIIKWSIDRFGMAFVAGNKFFLDGADLALATGNTYIYEQSDDDFHIVVGDVKGLQVEEGITDATEANVVIGEANILLTTVTDGFLYIPSMAGDATGTPTSFTGKIPIAYDTTNNELKIFTGGAWRTVTTALQ